MKRTYQAPEAEVKLFESADILTASGEDVQGMWDSNIYDFDSTVNGIQSDF